MTIRDGGRPRDDRTDTDPYDTRRDGDAGRDGDPVDALPRRGHEPLDDAPRLASDPRRRVNAPPYDERARYDTAWPEHDPRAAYAPAYRTRQGGSGVGGFLRFLIFALVLAAIVLLVLVTALRPIVRGAIVGWAGENPAALRLPFVADLVREDLGPALDRPASADSSSVPFTVNPGDTATTIADRLADQKLVSDRRAFLFIAIEKDLTTKLNAGDYSLRRNMTPNELVTTLLAAPTLVYVDIPLRESLRLEQVTAKLQTLPLNMDVKDFYELAKHPPDSLVEEHPWLKELGLPSGTSLEGFLYPATYRVLPDATPEQLVGMMLDKFYKEVGKDRLAVPKARGLTFYQVMTLASIVEHEAVLDEERPLIAGVYQNRLNAKGATSILNADPVVFYALDTIELDKMDFTDWKKFTFWKPPGVGLNEVQLPAKLAGYQSYQRRGLPPGPICTPSLKSLDAALKPNTKAGYFYFLAIPNGDGAHAFAKNITQHNANKKKYGYA
ncbi:MAG TPA: endolytic transglycosylase MltG [Candidatus Limnocylindrales bacterium]|nr:endolytic transglycosylase MltG [Candidatus Limnocylindrales bacterium]